MQPHAVFLTKLDQFLFRRRALGAHFPEPRRDDRDHFGPRINRILHRLLHELRRHDHDAEINLAFVLAQVAVARHAQNVLGLGTDGNDFPRITAGEEIGDKRVADLRGIPRRSEDGDGLRLNQLLKHNNNELKLGLFLRCDSPTFGRRLTILVIPSPELGLATLESPAPG